jgi:hypothetical protein
MLNMIFWFMVGIFAVIGFLMTAFLVVAYIADWKRDRKGEQIWRSANCG